MTKFVERKDKMARISTSRIQTYGSCEGGQVDWRLVDIWIISKRALCIFIYNFDRVQRNHTELFGNVYFVRLLKSSNCSGSIVIQLTNQRRKCWNVWNVVGSTVELQRCPDSITPPTFVQNRNNCQIDGAVPKNLCKRSENSFAIKNREYTYCIAKKIAAVECCWIIKQLKRKNNSQMQN